MWRCKVERSLCWLPGIMSFQWNQNLAPKKTKKEQKPRWGRKEHSWRKQKGRLCNAGTFSSPSRLCVSKQTAQSSSLFSQLCLPITRTCKHLGTRQRLPFSGSPWVKAPWGPLRLCKGLEEPAEIISGKAKGSLRGPTQGHPLGFWGKRGATVFHRNLWS